MSIIIPHAVKLIAIQNYKHILWNLILLAKNVKKYFKFCVNNYDYGYIFSIVHNVLISNLPRHKLLVLDIFFEALLLHFPAKRCYRPTLEVRKRSITFPTSIFCFIKKCKTHIGLIILINSDNMLLRTVLWIEWPITIFCSFSFVKPTMKGWSFCIDSCSETFDYLALVDTLSIFYLNSSPSYICGAVNCSTRFASIN